MARCKINRYHLAKALHGRVIVRLIRATASPNGGNRPCALQTARNHSHASWTAKRNVAQHSGHRRKRKSAAPLWSWLQNGSNNTLTMKTFFFSVLHCFHSTQFLLLTSGHLSHHQSWLSCEEKRESWGVLVTCDGPSSASSCLHPMHGNYAEGWRPQTRQKLKCGVGES